MKYLLPWAGQGNVSGVRYAGRIEGVGYVFNAIT